MKKIICLVFGLMLVLIGVNTVLAAEFLEPGDDGNITIEKDEQVKNLYTAGNLVSIEGDVQKGLYAVGNIVTINGNVENNVVVVGSTVIIRGDVGGSVHVGGGSVVVEGKITDDLFIGGGSVVLAESASVGGDLVLGGGTVVVNSPVAGNVYVSAGQATLNSTVGGKVEAKVGQLTLGNKAVVSGDLDYTAPGELSKEDGASILGKTDYTKTKTVDASKQIAGLLTLMFFVKILIGITTALVFIYLLRNKTERMIKENLGKFWSNLGVGFASSILVPIVAVILLVTVIGALLGGIVGVLYLLGFLIAAPIASITLGSLILKLVNKKSEYTLNWFTAILGVVAINVIALVPFVGWIVVLAFVLASLGTLYKEGYRALVSK